MVFNSYTFIYFFLPISLLGWFFTRNSRNSIPSISWVVIVSLFFYSYPNPIHFFLILISIFVNYYIGKYLINKQFYKKSLLWLGISFNLGLLGWFKYANFAIENISLLFGFNNPSILHILLPLGISFYSFQQISYLVDSYKGIIQKDNFISYIFFVCFFPQLLAGPIVRYSEIVPQIKKVGAKYFSWNNMYIFILYFAIGLFKKVVLADSLAPLVEKGYSSTHSLSFIQAWATSLLYTFQLYFDFSGYTDMAMGTAKLFGINLPINFHSPYKAINIQDFWRRWHITLSRFLRDYIYIPLGGNRRGTFKTYRNILFTFFLAGIWHGVGWTFILWGIMHGGGLAIFRFFSQYFKALPRFLSIGFTFFFVHFTWIPFRAESLNSMIEMLKAMFFKNGFIVQYNLQYQKEGLWSIFPQAQIPFWICISLLIIFLCPNSNEIINRIGKSELLSIRKAIVISTLTGIIFFICIAFMGTVDSSTFLYLNF